MRPLRIAAIAITALMSIGVASAQSKVLYQLTGTVGDDDGNWASDNSENELYVSLSNYLYGPQLLRISFSGPSPIIYDHSFGYALYSYDNYQCQIISGCSQSQLIHTIGDDNASYPFPGDPLPNWTSFSSWSSVVDPNYYYQYLSLTAGGLNGPCPKFIQYNDSCSAIEQQGLSAYTVDIALDESAFGKPFSLTVTTVPEPSIWTLTLGGLGLAGAALRKRRLAALP